MSHRIQLLCTVALLHFALGCDAPNLPSAPVAVAPPAVDETAAAEPEQTGVATASTRGGYETPAPPPDTLPVTDTPRPFDARDPIRGRRSRAAGGYLGATASARFVAEHKMLIINITECLNLYWAEHGDYPKSNEEFMENIIAFNKLVLPEIEPNWEYIFVPEEPEKGLQVRLKPGAAPAAATAVDAAQEPAQEPPAGRPPVAEPAPRAIGVEGMGGAAGVAPLDLQ